MTSTGNKSKPTKRTRNVRVRTTPRVPQVVPPEDRNFYLGLGPYARRVYVAALRVGPIPPQ